MIKYRQKEFIAPLVMPLVMGASTILGGAQMIQASKQAKEGKKQSERAEELMRKQNEKLEKIAKAAKENPELARQVTEVKNYSAIMNLGKTVYQAGKGVFSSGIKSNVTLGLGTAGAAYLGGKYIQHDMKKNKLDIDENGNLVGKSYSALDNVKKVAGNVAGKAAMPVLFGGAPLVLGYHADKAQMKDQIKAIQPQQKQYSYASSALSWLSKNWKSFKAHPGQSTTGTINSLASFGLGGTKNVQKFASGLSEYGAANGSQAAKKAGEWMMKHKTAANAITAVPLAGAASLTWDGTQKVAEKVGKTVDPGAYKYQDSKKQQVRQ